MLSERRLAQLGLVAAFTILAGSIAVLLARDVSGHRVPRVVPGDQAPEIQLKDVTGRTVSIADQRGRVLLLCFDSPRYPAASTDYRGRIHRLADQFGVKVIEIQSDAEADCQQASVVADSGFTTVLDCRGEVAARYDVNVGPTFVLIDRQGVIRYRGALDDSVNEAKATRHYLADALASLTAGKPVVLAFVQAYGRPIK